MAEGATNGRFCKRRGKEREEMERSCIEEEHVVGRDPRPIVRTFDCVGTGEALRVQSEASTKEEDAEVVVEDEDLLQAELDEGDFNITTGAKNETTTRD